MTDEKFMQLAIEKAKEGVKDGQTPFGACIVKDDEIVTCVHNVVWKTTDITAHAEVHAIRQACKKLNTIDLSGCTIYSTCEPCPMCFSAIHWARIAKVVYGARIEDAKDAGFNELSISNTTMKEFGRSPVEIVRDFLREENQALFREWANSENKRAY
ncbi:nucleoside deaminase [candidate division KSB1 bacterium]|nr:nucleoside deaminase [candidate division KSB1 bacterium]